MKRLLSLVLALTVLASALLCFTSCDELSIADVTDDPLSALTKAEENAMDRFFDDDYGIGKIAEQATEKGSVALTFGGEIPGYGIHDIAATLYTDTDGKRAALSLTLSENDSTYAVNLFQDENGSILDSESLLGVHGPIAILYDTFEEKFPSSALSQLVSGGETPDPEALNAFKQQIEAMKTQGITELLERAEENEKTLREIISLMNMTAAETTLNGEDCAELTFTLDNAVLRAVLLKLLDLANLPEAEKNTLLEELDFDALDETLTLNMTLKVYVTLKDAYLVKESVLISLTQKEGKKEEITLSLNALFGENAISLEGSAESSDGDSGESFSIALNKSREDAVTKYTLTAATGNSAPETLATYTYDSEARTFKLTFDVEDTTLTVKGEITLTKTTASLTITEIGSGGVFLKPELSLTFDADADFPATPENTRDAVELTESEWKNLISYVEQSPLVKLIETLTTSPLPEA